MPSFLMVVVVRISPLYIYMALAGKEEIKNVACSYIHTYTHLHLHIPTDEDEPPPSPPPSPLGALVDVSVLPEYKYILPSFSPGYTHTHTHTHTTKIQDILTRILSFTGNIQSKVCKRWERIKVLGMLYICMCAYIFVPKTELNRTNKK